MVTLGRSRGLGDFALSPMYLDAAVDMEPLSPTDLLTVLNTRCDLSVPMPDPRTREPPEEYDEELCAEAELVATDEALAIDREVLEDEGVCGLWKAVEMRGIGGGSLPNRREG